MNDAVEALIKAEAKRANKKWPPYHSKHEAYGVLVEEWDEAKDNVSYLKRAMRHLRDNLRYDENYSDNLDCFDRLVRDNFNTDVKHVRLQAYNAICELVQVAAVCDRWAASKEAKGD